MTLAEEVRGIFATSLYGKTLKSASRWAQRCRIMGKPVPGNYSFKYHPWMREIHDCKDQEICIRKGAQAGVTEGLVNIGLYYLDQQKVNVFYALPTTTPDAHDFSTARIGGAIDLSPYIKGMFTKTDRVGLKRTATNTLYIRGVKSRSQIKSIDTACLLADEVDEFPDWSIPLIRKRMSGQLTGDKKLIGASTPSIDGLGIDLWYSESTQDHYWFRCPHCTFEGKGRYIEFTHECMVITADSPNDPKIKGSYYQCPHCHNKIDHELKHEYLNESGIWIPSIKDSILRGFYIHQMYGMPEPWENAREFLLGLTDPYAEQEYWNSNMGKPHIVDGSVLTHKVLDECKIGAYKLGDNFGPGIRTMGIDVGKQLHYVVKHWSFPDGRRSKEINEDAVGRFSDIGTVERFLDLDRIIARFNPAIIVIDANPETREAKRLALRHMGRCFICYYGRDAREREINLKQAELSVSANRTSWLDATLSRYRSKTSVLPMNTPVEFEQHLMNTIRVYKMAKDKTREKAEYKKRGADHYAHADNYAEIALNLLSHSGVQGNLNMDFYG